MHTPFPPPQVGTRAHTRRSPPALPTGCALPARCPPGRALLSGLLSCGITTFCLAATTTAPTAARAFSRTAYAFLPRLAHPAVVGLCLSQTVPPT